ncbi:MAG TPA: phage holin family protein [Phototrophicaceae bacterium]|nr:phage holin family protein [Phototrophicaceae bacterium]
MRNLILRFLINAVAIAVITSGLLPGITIIGSQMMTIAIVALIFGLVNSLIKPIVRVLTCPVVLLTLGLFTFVINGAMLELTAILTTKFTVNLTRGSLDIENFAWAILGALIISVIDVALEAILIRSGSSTTTVIRYESNPPPITSGVDGNDDDDLFDGYDPNTGKIKR